MGGKILNLNSYDYEIIFGKSVICIINIYAKKVYFYIRLPSFEIVNVEDLDIFDCFNDNLVGLSPN